MRARPAPNLTPLRIAPVLRLAPLLLALASCSFFDARDVSRGQKITAEQLRELIPGTSTRADAASLLGSPTARAAFDDNTWIYISQQTRTRVARLPGVDQQDVVTLTFNQAGTLKSVRTLTRDDAKSVAMQSGATPSPGSEASFLGELLGNVGRFTPGGLGALGGGGGTPSGGAPTP